MQIYLPVAEMSVNVLLILGMGGAVGFLSGMFGVGGGFLMTPLLIFIGVPPAVAVGTEANQIVASSVSGVIAHWRRGNVDVKMGLVLVAGGFAGSGAGVLLFRLLRGMGQIDLVISLSYVGLLGLVGLLMLIETLMSMRSGAAGRPPGKRHIHHVWHGLPFRTRFSRSGLYISALLPLGVGAFGGLLAALMGVGGGFILVPLMIYVLGMPTAVVVGTSLFQMIFVTANVTVLQAITTQSVDLPLALILLAGGAVGAQFGSRLGARLGGEKLRLLLALIVLAVCVEMTGTLVLPPSDPFSLE